MADAGKIARKLFQAVTSGDLATAQSLQADDIVLHVPGNNQVSGTYKGKEEFATAIGKIEQLTGGTLKRELHDITSSDSHAVALVRATAQRDGKSYSWNAAVVLDIRGGKVAEQWMLNDSPETMDEVLR